MSKKRQKNGDVSGKKAAVLEGKGKKDNKTFIIGLVVLGIIGLIGYLSMDGGSVMKGIEAEAGMVKIPVSEVSDGQAHHFTYKGKRSKINFFVLKSSDGVLRAAFDACDVCFREKKGYSQSGDYMVCNNCGQRFASVKINEIKGGCNPAPLKRRIEGNFLVFNVDDIEEGGKYF